MPEEKNAMISFSFYPKDYSDVYLSFNCSEDLDFEDLVDFFKRFAFALGYSPNTIEAYLSEN